MLKFDCLAKDIPLFGHHFLEASAGTGKTFAIEHVVARLVLNGVDLEQILVVTFTRAATRELKLRIRSNLDKILKEGAQYLDSSSSKQKLADALNSFERCQIFTIHSFCSRMLQEFGFDLGILCNIGQPNSSQRNALLADFFEFQLSSEVVCLEQLRILLRKVGSVQELAARLKSEEASISKLYPERFREFQLALTAWGDLDEKKLIEDFRTLQSSYKKGKGDLEAQVKALAQGFFEVLIREKGTLFSFLSPENRKVKAKEPAFLHYPGFFDWCFVHLAPLIESASDPKEIMQSICAVWKPIERKAMFEEGILNPDAILIAMREAIQNQTFRGKIQKKYRAILIDEFQDTDPTQWEIFQTLFLESETLYLIGDPKQSIYRFRKADLYTYLQAKEAIASERHFYLDTNFRSCKPMIETLNHLFDREWLRLPKYQQCLPYLPVRAGLDLNSNFQDGKESVHCVLFEQEEQIPYIVREIVHLSDHIPYDRCAVLVKDRYEAAAVQKALFLANIPSSTRSQELLVETTAFQAIEELFDALYEPRNLSIAKTVLAGPFGGYTDQEIRDLEISPFPPLRKILDEKGLPVMCYSILSWRFKNSRVEQILSPSFLSDCKQVFEALFEWEQRSGFSFEGIRRWFKNTRIADPEEAILRSRKMEENAVQIMKIHSDKVLEFDVVFAFGLSSYSLAENEEAEAEKLRQLYVALTRAKKRLYIPFLLQSTNGKNSPIELFCRSLSINGDWENELTRIANQSSLSLERIAAPISLEKKEPRSTVLSPPEILKIPSYQPSYLLSFTAVSRSASEEILDPLPEPEGNYTMQNFPRGAKTGVIIHRIFERIISEKKDAATIVGEEFSLTAYNSWAEAVVSMVQNCFDLELVSGLFLRNLKKMRPEVEFFYENKDHCWRGTMDLLFEHENKLYILDWKTNWLKNYSLEHLQAAIAAHQYDLQASIYAEAIRRSGKELGGAFYVFVRGPNFVFLET